MEKAYFTEVELALRWNLSPKTLQRWRTDGRGPHFLKFPKSVRYPIDEIMVFENKSMRDSTSSRPGDIYTTYGDDLLSMKQTAQATGLSCVCGAFHPVLSVFAEIDTTTISPLLSMHQESKLDRFH